MNTTEITLLNDMIRRIELLEAQVRELTQKLSDMAKKSDPVRFK